MILLVSAILGFYQENSAADALRQLIQLVQVNTMVLRNAAECSVPIADTVPGDIVLLSAGNTIPGDCRLLESKDLFTDEATLTGETLDTTLAERTNTLFLGTHYPHHILHQCIPAQTRSRFLPCETFIRHRKLRQHGHTLFG